MHIGVFLRCEILPFEIGWETDPDTVMVLWKRKGCIRGCVFTQTGSHTFSRWNVHL